MTVFSASLTVYVPKLATSPLMTALYSSAVPWSILLGPNLGRSERVMNWAKLPFASNMKMPFGSEPQRLLLVPSAFTSSAETKVQVPTICFLSVFPFCCAGAVPATPASIAPISIVSANLRCAFMAVPPEICCCVIAVEPRLAARCHSPQPGRHCGDEYESHITLFCMGSVHPHQTNIQSTSGGSRPRSRAFHFFRPLEAKEAKASHPSGFSCGLFRRANC